jgi:hypothetical protein
MLATMLQDFVGELEAQVEQWAQELWRTLDLAKLEEELSERMQGLYVGVVGQVLTELLSEPSYLEALRRLGGRRGMRFKEYRRVTVRVGQGQDIEVVAPYFVKAGAKRGRKKRWPNGRGAQLGLEVLGFIGRCSARLVSEVVQMAVLCPSFEVAHQVLGRRGIALDVKTLRRLCRDVGEKGLPHRGVIALTGSEELRGQTLVIGIDGGRLRERRPKRGRKQGSQKRPGYHTEWKEPKLFTLYLLDIQGQIVKEFAPLHDGTMQDHEGLFAVLEQYLQALDLGALEKIVFCGDGAPWIWSGVEDLLSRWNVPSERVYQVLDYTHAKQNLQERVELLPAPLKQAGTLAKRWKNWLWQGDLVEIYESLCRVLTGKKKTHALKKWQNYFERNAARMQYEHFRQAAVPCGSGCVESAIRRVINLRLKAPGTFWTQDMAECFLFLRSQLLSGRWDTFIDNVARLTRQWIKPLPQLNNLEELYELPQAA